jgi:hypothetical protein
MFGIFQAGQKLALLSEKLLQLFLKKYIFCLDICINNMQKNIFMY